MRVLVTGVGGQLGHDVMNELARRGYDGIGTDLAPVYSGVADGSPVTKMPYLALDLTDEEAVTRTVRAIAPDAVVHCAAWTAVDAAEDPAVYEKVMKVNGAAPGFLASACETVGAKILYLSTDYIFDGQGERPWQPDDRNFAPLNVYGQSKLAGEQAVAAATDRFFIVRIAWVFGKNGKNFIRTMLGLADRFPELRVVNDQIGTPTYTFDLARLLVDMLETEKFGFYHATNEGGYISWYDFACEIFRQAGKSVKVTPVTTAEYGLSKAARPFNSRLDKSKLREAGFTLLPDWRDALARYLEEMKELS